MKNTIAEAEYPIVFRQDDARELGKYIKLRQSVVLIGAKRVGISNFLRFFLHHTNIVDTYIDGSKNHLFIPVDLNDLVELDMYPFWTLTLKRIVDSLIKIKLPSEVRNNIHALFLDSIQSQNTFITIDSIRKTLIALVDNEILPTLFFIRFDRIKGIVTKEFFANLQGLKEAAHHKLCYVLTSFRSLDVLSSSAFSKSSLSAFSRDLYIKPAKKEDAKIIFKMYIKHSKSRLPYKTEKDLFRAVDGYVQYLQLALVSLAEEYNLLVGENNIFEYLAKDERILLASEELWESLDEQEKSLLVKIANKEPITNAEIEKNKYLWDTGLVMEENNNIRIFSSIFEYHVKRLKKKSPNSVVEFTKKENLLFKYLLENHDGVCEREQIVKAVWPEVEELGVSDWAIDRLVARARHKLKLQKTNYEIKTVKTRGYKLVEI
jgi:DNA-binding winged helix-turn-helix (wHTH) protein